MRLLYPALLVSTILITACANEPKGPWGEGFFEELGKDVTGQHHQPSNTPKMTPEGKNIAQDCEEQRNQYVKELYLWSKSDLEYKRMAEVDLVPR